MDTKQQHSDKLDLITWIAQLQDSEVIEKLKKFRSKTKTDREDSSYDPDFVKKVKKSEKQFEKGEFNRVNKSDIPKLLGLE